MAIKYPDTAVKLALPKGKLLNPTSALLSTAELGFKDYNSNTRIYRLKSDNIPNLSAKMLNERDIPIQVAIGNYDFGICSSDWLQELQTRYPSSRVFKVADLNYDRSAIFLACSNQLPLTLNALTKSSQCWRIVSEYPALAETVACRMRLKRFRIFPLWGSAEVYPPESADLAVLKATGEESLAQLQLLPIHKVCDSNACIIANRDSLESKDLSVLLARLSSAVKNYNPTVEKPSFKTLPSMSNYSYRKSSGYIRMALADGHQQTHTANFLKKTTLKLDGYTAESFQRRPSCNLDWVNVKVIRPQDMPQQVANGNFDLAITGRDWLLDHLYQFPSSPVEEIIDLKFGWVKIVAVVSEDFPADSIDEIKRLTSSAKFDILRTATEYTNIADKYLRDRHIDRYRVIPTWGATEAYLPEDADMLIENTETGQTLRKHRLKIIDTIFESTACLIGNRISITSLHKRNRITEIIKIFREAVN